MKLKELTAFLDSAIPLSFQESYDNSGLQAGDPDLDINSALLTIDVTEAIVNEAVNNNCNLILSHHPLIFNPIRTLTGKTATERVLIRALKENIAVYSAHTNLDSISNGVSRKMAEKLSLKNIRVLTPLKNHLLKLVTFVPESHIGQVSEAVFNAGAGVIGNYDRCGFNASGLGTYRGNENTTPFKGQKLEFHHEKEIRFETILLSHIKSEVLQALLNSHPYEEVAYDLYVIDNEYYGAGLGCSGELTKSLSEKDFLKKLSEVFGSGIIRHSALSGRKIKSVALCGGAGISLLKDAMAGRADAFVTGDIRYHDFFKAEGKILLADIGHFESEKFTSELLYDLIIKKFPTFALRFSEINTNPINYF